MNVIRCMVNFINTLILIKPNFHTPVQTCTQHVKFYFEFLITAGTAAEMKILQGLRSSTHLTE